MVATSIGIAISTAMGAVMSALSSVGAAVAGSIGLSVGTAAAATGSLTTITAGTAAAIGAASIAGAAAGGASGVIGGLSAYQTGKAQQEVYNYNASVAERNAELARQQGLDEAAEQRRQTKRLIAQQNNTFGALGLTSGTGTALDLVSESAYMGELNALTAKYNRDLEAWNYDTEAISLRYQGEVAASKGKMGLITGLVKAGSTVLTMGLGASGAASSLGSKITSGLAQAFDKPIVTSGGILGDAITFA